MKSKKNLIGANVLLGMFILITFSCASIVSKSKYPLTVNSNPSGAVLIVTDKKGNEIYNGTTPTTLTLKAGAGFFSMARYQLRIEKEGYQVKNIPVDMTFDGWYIGNIIFGGLIGLLIIDPATGAMWKLDISNLDVSLDAMTALNQNRNLNIYDINEIPDEWKDKLIPIE